MTIDTVTPQCRRALLGAAVAAVGGLVASVVGSAAPVSAATGDSLVLGHIDNAADSSTMLTSTGAVLTLELNASGAGDRTALRAQGSNGGFGVAGISYSGTGVSGASQFGRGVHGLSTDGDGVFGEVDAGGTGAALKGRAPSGRGAVLSGGKAQLHLVPSTRNSHPSSGSTGDIFLDKHKRLWLCKGGTSWHQLA